MFTSVNNIHPVEDMRSVIKGVLDPIATFAPAYDDKYLNLFQNRKRMISDVNTMWRRRYKCWGTWSEDQVVQATAALSGLFGIDNVVIMTGVYESGCGYGTKVDATYIHINFKDVVTIEKPEITSQKAANKAFREDLKENPIKLVDGTLIKTVRMGRARDAIMLREHWCSWIDNAAKIGMIPSKADWSFV